jgi:hypothetical protein
MPPILRNILAVLLGAVVGAVVNGALITISPQLIPPPAGVDVTQTESLAQSIHLFEPKHFVMPFLAHAVGTLVGALVAFLLAAGNRSRMAYIVGVLFLCGGIAACFMIPAPKWFMAVDLLLAYIPMAWLGIQIGNRLKLASHHTS